MASVNTYAFAVGKVEGKSVGNGAARVERPLVPAGVVRSVLHAFEVFFGNGQIAVLHTHRINGGQSRAQRAAVLLIAVDSAENLRSAFLSLFAEIRALVVHGESGKAFLRPIA